MLSLSLVFARARLLRTPAAIHSATRLSCKINSKAGAGVIDYNHHCLQNARPFSTTNGAGIEGEDQDKLGVKDDGGEKIKRKNGELSALERLLLHSQQFQLDEDDNNVFASKDDKEEEGNDPFSSKLPSSSRPNNTRDSRSTRNTFRRRRISHHHWQLGQQALGQVIGKETDEINYESELENVWDEQELKLRKFHQALHREKDKDYVCSNCGERGHRPRNCLLPRICSNCGNLGHAAHQCRHRRLPDSVDEFLLEEKARRQQRKTNKKLQQKAAKAAKNPNLPRLKEVPTSDFYKRNESLRRELDAELDTYADKLEEKARKRLELARQTKLDDN